MKYLIAFGDNEYDKYNKALNANYYYTKLDTIHEKVTESLNGCEALGNKIQQLLLELKQLSKVSDDE